MPEKRGHDTKLPSLAPRRPSKWSPPNVVCLVDVEFPRAREAPSRLLGDLSRPRRGVPSTHPRRSVGIEVTLADCGGDRSVAFQVSRVRIERRTHRFARVPEERSHYFKLPPVDGPSKWSFPHFV